MKSTKHKSSLWRVRAVAINTILLLVVISPSVIAQTIFIKKVGADETTFSLNDIRKITFPSNTMNISMVNNTEDIFPLPDLQYLSFLSYYSNIFELEQNTIQTLNCYPNPTINILNIEIPDTNDKPGTLKIFNSEGELIQSLQIKNTKTTTLNTSHLSAGTYVLLYQGTQEIRTKKIIKQ